jgi:hypothetical protein
LLIFAGRNLLSHQLKMGNWYSSRKIPRFCFVEGYPGRGKFVYEGEVYRNSHVGPYTFKFDSPTGIITGISCCPVKDEKIQSPEATVTEGGVNCKYVHIRLEPREEGDWACKLVIAAEDD